MARLRVCLRSFLPLAAAGLLAALVGGSAPAQASAFSAWLDGLKREAAAAGISQATIARALGDLEPIERVVELDRKQPEFTQTFWGYLDRSVTPERIARGRQLLADHAGLLERVQARYGVQPRFLVAFWGLESNYGEHTGGFPVIGALATLAYDERRSGFFRAQLIDALRILDQGHVALETMNGSWAGAMGQLQFIPSTFLHYAVDFDGDGRRDIWRSLPDVFASAAHFLTSIGWRGDQTWGREVRLPADFDWNLASPELRKPVAEWARLGVRAADGGALGDGEVAAAILLPGGALGPAFLAYPNLDVILGWNRSQLYAIAVGHLADRIAGQGPLQAERPLGDQALSRWQVEEMQGLLASLGFDPGSPDGVVGSKTRTALKAFQRRINLAPDGHPTPELLERLRGAATGKPDAG